LTYLIDTNVISETRRKQPDARVMHGIANSPRSSLYLSVLTLGEIAKGATLLAQRDEVAGGALQTWLDEIRSQFHTHIVPIDAPIAENWGQLAARRSLPVIDGLIASTAMVRGFVLVTRNTRDFEGLGIQVINPWQA